MRYSRADSAGIQIVTNPDTSRNFTWTVETDYTLIPNAAQENRLFGVADATQRGDSVFVANAGTYEVQVYAAAGDLLRVIGREGDGPGEFERLEWARIVGDSLFTYDRHQHRISVFVGAQDLARSYTLSGRWRTHSRVFGPFTDGKVIEVRTGIHPLSFVNADEGVRRDTIVFRVHDREGNETGTLPSALGAQAFWMKRGGSRSAEYWIAPMPFSSEVVVGRSRDYIVLGNNSEYSLHFHDTNGRLVRIVRLARPARVVTESDKDEYVHRASAAAIRPDLYEELFQHMKFGSSWPFFSGILADELDFLWVREYIPPEVDARFYDVFAPDGTYCGRVDLGLGMEILFIGVDRLIAKHVNEDGVEHLRVHRLVREGPCLDGDARACCAAGGAR